MTRRQLERGIWAATVIVVTAGWWAGSQQRSDGGGIGGPHRPRIPPPPEVSMFDDSLVSAATARVASHDPFRLDRHPTSVAFSTNPQSTPMAPAAPKIQLALHGTIGGPPWQAILSGIPGHEGTVVLHAGDTLGGVLVRRVMRDSAVVRVKDSTWAVSLARGGR